MAFDGIPLGEDTAYQFSYDASLLFPIARNESRKSLVLSGFNGIDRWTAFELSWLDCSGKPQVAIAEFDFDANSENLVESKSFKLYLNSLNQTRFKSQEQLVTTMREDLSRCSGKPVEINLFALSDVKFTDRKSGDSNKFMLLDELDVCCDIYDRDASLLTVKKEVDVQYYASHLFRSLCPVTSQPDWASVFITVNGKMLCEKSLLQYLVSYRNHQGFHEQCVEQIFLDLKALGVFEEISVYARFMRRGGLDINPLRTTASLPVIPEIFDARQ